MTRLVDDLQRLGDALLACTTVDLANEERSGGERERRADATLATRVRQPRGRRPSRVRSTACR